MGSKFLKSLSVLVVALALTSPASASVNRKPSWAAANGAFFAIPETGVEGTQRPTVRMKVACDARTCKVRSSKVDKADYDFVFTTGAENPITLDRVKIGSLPDNFAYLDWDTLTGYDVGWNVGSRPAPPEPIRAVWEHVSKGHFVRQVEACYEGQEGVEPSEITGWVPCRGEYDPAVNGGSYVAPDGTVLNGNFLVHGGVGDLEGNEKTITREMTRALAAELFSSEFGRKMQFVRECKFRLHHGLVLSESDDLTALVWQTPVGECPSVPTDASLDVSFQFEELVDTTWGLVPA